MINDVWSRSVNSGGGGGQGRWSVGCVYLCVMVRAGVGGRGEGGLPTPESKLLSIYFSI